MKAVGLYRYLPVDHPEALLDLEVDEPVAAGRDLLVEVKAISVNPVDTKRRAPKDLVEKTPKILGWDAAGIVKSAGPDCQLFKPGDAVYYAGSIVRQGANCQFHLVDERIAGPRPANLSFAEAAALPLTTLTAWELMFDRMGISKAGTQAGRSLLILGGAGGVGSIAIQLAKNLAKLKVTASASRPESIAWCKSLGADATVDHAKTIEGEFDYVLCFNNSDAYWPQFPRLVKPQGKVGLIVRTVKPVDLAILHDKSIARLPGGHVHALDLPDAGHGRAARAAGGGGDAGGGGRAEDDADAEPRQDQRGKPPARAQAAGGRARHRQAGAGRLVRR